MANTCQHKEAHISRWLGRLGGGGGRRTSTRRVEVGAVVGSVYDDCGSAEHRAYGRGYATINMPRLPDSLPLLPLCAVKIQSQLLGRARTRLPLATPPQKKVIPVSLA